MTETPQFAQVAVDVPLLMSFTYRVPSSMAERIRPGHLVHVPWRNYSRTAIILSLHPDNPSSFDASGIKDIEDIIEPIPVLDAELLELISFIATYYRAPIGECAMMAVPNAFRRSGTRVFSLTEAGRDALRSAMRPLRTALELLAKAERQTVPGPDLTDWVRGLTYLTLDQAVEDGLLTTEYALERPKVKISTEKWVRLTRVPRRGTRMGRVQSRIMDVLKIEGSIALRDLDARIKGGVRSSVKTLVQKRWVSVDEREVIRDPFDEEDAISAPQEHVLSGEQSAALDAIHDSPPAGSEDGYRPFLLHGVTGSGKTEVYIRAIRAERERFRTALVLLPEIALTPQFCGIFRSHFGDDVAVLHSGLTPGERYDAWRRLRSGDVGIAIGARSALFAPMKDLGIIIVDEEHETSFKQEDTPRYNARDMALVRGSLARCKVILGSATPSLESIHLAHAGRITYLPMRQRAKGRPLPEVDLIDMKRQPGNEDAHRRGKRASRGKALARARRQANESDHELIKRTLSDELIEAIEETLSRGQQVIILLNRRGHSTFVQCTFCGKALYCPNCTVSLTYHQHINLLRCHYCDFARGLPSKCTGCGRPDLGLLGIGTEKLTLLLSNLFPEATVERLDRDTGGGKRLRSLMRRFRAGDVNILVGTQMVAKGHDVHNVTLVGVVMADLTLNFPDFRASERTFQLLTQVAGRAGRGEMRGSVIIQSLTPDHYALLAAREHDFDRFASDELTIREERNYPPFNFLIAVKFEATRAELAERCSVRWAHTAKAFIEQHRRSSDDALPITLLGPTAAPLGKIRGRSRFQLLLKCDERKPMRLIVEKTYHALADELKNTYRSVRVITDVDPINML